MNKLQVDALGVVIVRIGKEIIFIVQSHIGIGIDRSETCRWVDCLAPDRSVKCVEASWAGVKHCITSEENVKSILKLDR